MKFLITSVGTATSVNLIKYIKKNNDIVIGTDINLYGYTAGSLLVDEFVQVPLATDENYVQTIISIIEKYNIDILIPINDIEIYTLASVKEKLECICIIPEAKDIELMQDKLLCSRKIADMGISVSEIFEKDDTFFKRILRDRIGVGSKGIYVIEKGVDCPSYDIKEKFLQRYVEGEEYTIDILSDQDGKPYYIIPRKRLEVKSGVATKVRIEKCDELIKYASDILTKIRIPGFCNMQFIKDSNGVFWFVEINYRFSGCGAATLAVTPNYLTTYKDIVTNKKINQELNQDVRWNSIVTRYYEELVYEEGIS